MAFKVFLDVNIVVDYFLPQREGNNNARLLFEKIDGIYVQAYFSESVVNTTSYLVRKIISQNDYKTVMADLLSFIKVLPCSTDIIHKAYANAKNDLEDAVLYQIALNGKMDYFITSNYKDLKKIALPSLPVLSAKELLKLADI